MPDDETPTTDDPGRTSDRAEAWDRVGLMLEDLAGVGESIGSRSFAFWHDVAERLRTSDYDADALAADLMNGFTTALANAQDAWSLLAGPQARTATTVDLPTAFVRLARTVRDGSFGLASPLTIRVPRDVKDPPAEAAVVFRAPTGETEAILSRVLRPRLTGAAYLLETVDTSDALSPGLYSGLVLLSETGTPLAHLSVLVEDDAPRPGGGQGRRGRSR